MSAYYVIGHLPNKDRQGYLEKTIWPKGVERRNCEKLVSAYWILQLHWFTNHDASHIFVSYVEEGFSPQVSNEKLKLQLQSSCYFTKCSCFLLFDSNDHSLKHFQICGGCVCVCVCVSNPPQLPTPSIRFWASNTGNYFFVQFSSWFYLKVSEVISGNNLRKQSKESQWIPNYGAR